ncbi:hypothetical protein D3C87_1820920 [compost metagenome]
MTSAITTSLIKSIENSPKIFIAEAPMALRMPISLVRDSAINATTPYKPRHPIKIAMKLRILKSEKNLASFS